MNTDVLLIPVFIGLNIAIIIFLPFLHGAASYDRDYQQYLAVWCS